MKLKSKLMVGGLIAAVVPILITGIVAVFDSSRMLHFFAEQNLKNTAQNIAGDIESSLAHELRMTQTIASTKSVIELITKVASFGVEQNQNEIDLIQTDLARFKELAGNRYSAILLMTTNNIVFADSNHGTMNGLDLNGREYLTKAYKGQPNIGNVVVSRVSGKVIITAATAVYEKSNNSIVGAVVCSIFVQYLTDLTERSELGKNGYTYVISKEGLYIAHPDKAVILKENVSQIKGMETLAAHVQNELDGFVEYERNDIRNIAYVQSVKGSDWSVVATVPIDELQVLEHRLTMTIFGIALIAVVLAGTFFYFFAEKIVKPIKKLQAGTEFIGDGNLDYHLEISEHDEIGALARSFNDMAHKLTLKDQRVKTEIAERKAAEESTLQANTELQRSNEDLQKFAYVASHDLQEPLRAVVSYLQFLERLYSEKLDDKGREFIDRAVAATKRMQAMIQDLLAFSRVSSKSKPFEKCHLNELLIDTLEVLKSSIDTNAASITVSELPEVLADCSQLQQLFQNIIGNALKFCDKEQPVIHISCENRDGVNVFSIQDNGIGIEPEYYEKIFEIFQRLHGRAHYEGTGIGLALCRKIVERHGGSIWLESKPDEGTTFFFTLGKSV